MVQEASLVSLGELLEEVGETVADNDILERIKLLAQELLPDGWTAWKVTRLNRENLFGESIDPQIINRIKFALPTDQLVKAFVPEATRLSEKGVRDLKLKMLDWAFARALITSPPAICNKIRGSAAATERFNEAVKPERPMSRREADRALSLCGDGVSSTYTNRKSVSSETESGENWPTRPKRSRIDVLEQRMSDIFSFLMERIDSLRSNRKGMRMSSVEELSSTDDDDLSITSPRSESPNTWQARPLNVETDSAVKEPKSAIPAPSEQMRIEGISCQRFGSEAWNRIRYNEVAKKLQASPVFTALKVNPELRDFGLHTSGLLAKQDGVLGTISHGLLCQRKALAVEIKKLAAKFPAASDDLIALVSEGSSFKATSDDLLQYVCAHRAETIDIRRRSFKTKNEALAASLQQIPPSESSLFQEEKLVSFLQSNGGASRVLANRFARSSMKEKQPFQQPKKTQQARNQKPKNSTWQIRPTRTTTQSRKYPNDDGGRKRDEKKGQHKQCRRY